MILDAYEAMEPAIGDATDAIRAVIRADATVATDAIRSIHAATDATTADTTDAIRAAIDDAIATYVKDVAR